MTVETRLALGGVFLVVCLASLDHNIVATALPQVVADLGGVEHLGWVVTAFLLPSTVAMPLYGKMSDLYGQRNVLTFAVATFLVGSALCGLAQSMLQLILFRALQGVGAGGLFTLALTVIASTVAPAERARYQALVVGAVAVCQFAGPLAGGLITEHFSWRWVFLINPPVGLAALALIWLGIASKRAPDRPAIDYAGAATLMLGAALFMLGLTNILENAALGALLALGAAVAFGAFFSIERRARDPILPFRVFEAPAYARGVIALTGMTFAVHGTLAFTPLFLQAGLGLTPSESGAAMIAQVIGMVLCSAVVTRTSAVSGHLKSVALFGVALETVGIAGFAASALLHGGVGIFIFFLFARGLGMGASIPILTTLVQNAAPSRLLGVATSTMMFVRSFGGVIGVTVTGLVLALVAGAAPDGGAAIFHTAIGGAFALHALVMLASWLLVLTLPA